MCPGTLEFTGISTDGVLDRGWTGIEHDIALMSDGTVTVGITGCAGSRRPCGVCTFGGPIANAGAATYGAKTGTQFNNHRCTGNTRKTCGPGGEDPTCASAGGTCEFYVETLVPIGGLPLCAELRFSGAITGTANIETGSSASTVTEIERLFAGLSSTHPCPLCVGDQTPNDGIRGGTCSGGVDDKKACDVNGSSPNESFGSTSLDCRPNTSVLASSPIHLTYTTGTTTKTLVTGSPNCRASGFETFRCMCDTCADSKATPCQTDANCSSGAKCGGLRCIGGSQKGTPCNGSCAGGANAGASCNVGSQCPGSTCGSVATATCGRCVGGTNAGNPCKATSACPSSTCTGAICDVPGQATQPNACTGGLAKCIAGGTPGPNDGVCSSGPTEVFCQPNLTMIECTANGNGDCASAGPPHGSCVGGANAGNVCDVASECPGGSACTATCFGGDNDGAVCTVDAQCPRGKCDSGIGCCYEQCTGVKTRECFLDKGAIGGTDTASGKAIIPVNDRANPTLASLACVGPSSSGTANSAFGLPGLERIELQMRMQARP